MAEFEMTESHVVISSVGVQGPKGYSGIEAGPNPPSDTNVLWADTDDNFAVVAGSPISGTGFPEGAVAAPVGQRYIDTAATNGAVEWIKVSGSGSTGWKVAYGDTGQRDITSLLSLNGWNMTSDRKATIRRMGSTVTLSAYGVERGASDTMLNIPTGFVPDIYFTGIVPRGSGGTGAMLDISPGSQLVKIFNTAGTAPYYIGFSWETNTAWPTTLPGVAV